MLRPAGCTPIVQMEVMKGEAGETHFQSHHFLCHCFLPTDARAQPLVRTAVELVTVTKGLGLRGVMIFHFVLHIPYEPNWDALILRPLTPPPRYLQSSGINFPPLDSGDKGRKYRLFSLRIGSVLQIGFGVLLNLMICPQNEQLGQVHVQQT